MLLGTSKKRELSLLQIEKEMFLLRESAMKLIGDYYSFIAHYRGPYSKEIYESLISPLYLDDDWIYENSRDKLSGGDIRLTSEGCDNFKKLKDEIVKNKHKELIEIFAAMDILHDLYDKLTSKELLYFIYTSPEFKKYITKSIVYDEVVTEKTKESLRKKLAGGIQ